MGKPQTFGAYQKRSRQPRLDNFLDRQIYSLTIKLKKRKRKKEKKYTFWFNFYHIAKVSELLFVHDQKKIYGTEFLICTTQVSPHWSSQKIKMNVSGPNAPTHPPHPLSYRQRSLTSSRGRSELRRHWLTSKPSLISIHYHCSRLYTSAYLIPQGLHP